MQRLTPFGPRAFRLTLDDAWIDDIGGRIALSDALARIDGIEDSLVTEVAALVVCGSAPDSARREALEAAITRALDGSRARPVGSTTTRTIDVIYDGDDLDALGRELGLSREDLVRRHCASELFVSFLGFTPGFAYLRGLDPSLARVERRPTPRARVPAGAVAIAGGMSAIYPASSPGGWQLVGRVVDFDPVVDPLRPGERVRFRATDRSTRADVTPRDVASSTGTQLVVDAVSGPALLVDGHGVRRMSDGSPPGGPLVQVLADAALHAVSGARTDVLIERYGAITLRSALEHDVRIADETGHARTIARGESVAFAAPSRARVGYVAIEGGFLGTEVLGGRGTMLSIARGGHEGRPLRRGDRLYVGAYEHESPRSTSHAAPAATTVRAHRGPDRQDEGIVTLRARIAHASDRTGTRLVPLTPHGMQLGPARTTPMMRGAIQAPASGELIVLGPEHPVTGGYPVVGVLDPETCDALFAMPLGREVTLEIE